MKKDVYTIKSGKKVYYDEWGTGAYLRYIDTHEIYVTFTNHLDAEQFLRDYGVKNVYTGVFKPVRNTKSYYGQISKDKERK